MRHYALQSTHYGSSSTLRVIIYKSEREVETPRSMVHMQCAGRRKQRICSPRRSAPHNVPVRPSLALCVFYVDVDVTNNTDCTSRRTNAQTSLNPAHTRALLLMCCPTTHTSYERNILCPTLVPLALLSSFSRVCFVVKRAISQQNNEMLMQFENDRHFQPNDRKQSDATQRRYQISSLLTLNKALNEATEIK